MVSLIFISLHPVYNWSLTSSIEIASLHSHQSYTIQTTHPLVFGHYKSFTIFIDNIRNLDFITWKCYWKVRNYFVKLNLIILNKWWWSVTYTCTCSTHVSWTKTERQVHELYKPWFLQIYLFKLTNPKDGFVWLKFRSKMCVYMFCYINKIYWRLARTFFSYLRVQIDIQN